MSTPQNANPQSVPVRLLNLLQNLLPLVDDIANTLGVLLCISFGILIWIFCFMFYLQSYALKTVLIVTALIALPWMLLFRIWVALTNLKDIPEIAKRLIGNATDDNGQIRHDDKSGRKGALNVIDQAKKLLEIRSLLSNADDILAQYFNIGILINPLSLILGILSLITLFLLILIGGILAVVALL